MNNAELSDALVNAIDEAIRKSRCSTTEDWQVVVDEVLEQHLVEKPFETTTLHNEAYRTFKPSNRAVEITDRNHPDGSEVWRWPEFKAFAQRLGVYTEAPTTDLFIFIPCQGIVKIVQEYLGDEMFNIRKGKERE